MTAARSLGRDVKTSLAYGVVNNLTLRVGNLILGIVLARLLAPADFGVFAVALTIQLVLANLTDLGMTAFLVRDQDPDRRAPTVLTVGLATGALLALLMAGLAGPMAAQLGSERAAPVIRVLALTLVLSGVGCVPTAIIQRRFQQGRQFVADASSFLVSTGVALAMIASGFGVMSLAWSRLLGQLTAVLLLFWFSGYRGGMRFDSAVARAAGRFGVPLVGANVLSWLLLNMDYVLVGRALGATALGFYVLAFNVSSWPTSAIAQALRAVALPAFARTEQAGSANRSGQLGAAMALTFAASAPIGALLVALAAPVVAVVYGDQWAASAAPLAALAAFGAARPVFDLLATYLTARGSTKSVLVVQIIWTAALFPALMIGIHVWGVTGAGLAHLAVGLLVVLPAYLVAVRRQGIGIRPLLVMSVTPVGCALVAGAVAFGLAGLLQPEWVVVLLGGGIAGLAYLAGMARWVRRRLDFLRNADVAVSAPDPGRPQAASGVSAAHTRGRQRARAGLGRSSRSESQVEGVR